MVQLVLSIPVYTLGLWFFGKSAYHSLLSRVPNMDVLIFMGASSALFYSIFGTFYFWGSHEMHTYLFFETGASIITLVLFGNLLEKRSVKKTTNAIQSLTSLQVKTAQLITENNGEISHSIIAVKLLRKGDLIQVNSGDIVPIDAVVVSGEAECDESLMTGESLPIHKQKGEQVIGGALLLNGNLQVSVSVPLQDTILSQIIELVKKIMTISQVDIRIEYIKPISFTRNLVFDNTKLKKWLLVNETDIVDGLKEEYEYMKSIIVK
jgi:Cu+-exporting ATPase